jgi:D-beta-D-heptose 7-phosphate kinase/D-beta-D-heptose 1-phosphate adenosyltransferase
MPRKKRIALSGGFDPLHVAHLDMINDAAKYGDVIMVLNSDDWLRGKKGWKLMSWEDRKKILLNIKNVKDVVPVDDTDGTVCEALQRIKPHYFGNGGDRTKKNTPEMKICEELGIEMVWNLGGPKARSSSDLIYEVLYQIYPEMDDR